MVCNKARISAVLMHLCGQIFALLACSFSASALSYRISAPGWVASAIDGGPVLDGTYMLDDNKELVFSSGGITSENLQNLKNYIKGHTGAINLTFVKPGAGGLVCPLGSYKKKALLHASGWVCEPCPIGMYGGGDARFCTACPTGWTTSETGAETEADCRPKTPDDCVANEWWDDTTSDCQQCPGAYPNSDAGAEGEAKCYRECEKSDVEHAEAVSGGKVYLDGTQTCRGSCITDYNWSDYYNKCLPRTCAGGTEHYKDGTWCLTEDYEKIVRLMEDDMKWELSSYASDAVIIIDDDDFVPIAEVDALVALMAEKLKKEADESCVNELHDRVTSVSTIFRIYRECLLPI